jgi:N-acetylglucosaminyldiphosphoundecaprenol N-acetyl-beta-D-mannosaminyltransferase
MASHIGRLQAPVLIGVGAAFDFHAGLKQQAPRWIQRSGLEWLFRLVMEPRRLWRRYLINNPGFLWLILLQALGKESYALE